MWVVTGGLVVRTSGYVDICESLAHWAYARRAGNLFPVPGAHRQLQTCQPFPSAVHPKGTVILFKN